MSGLPKAARMGYLRTCLDGIKLPKEGRRLVEGFFERGAMETVRLPENIGKEARKQLHWLCEELEGGRVRHVTEEGFLTLTRVPPLPRLPNTDLRHKLIRGFMFQEASHTGVSYLEGRRLGFEKAVLGLELDLEEEEGTPLLAWAPVRSVSSPLPLFGVGEFQHATLLKIEGMHYIPEEPPAQGTFLSAGPALLCALLRLSPPGASSPPSPPQAAAAAAATSACSNPGAPSDAAPAPSPPPLPAWVDRATLIASAQRFSQEPINQDRGYHRIGVMAQLGLVQVRELEEECSELVSLTPKGAGLALALSTKACLPDPEEELQQEEEALLDALSLDLPEDLPEDLPHEQEQEQQQEQQQQAVAEEEDEEGEAALDFELGSDFDSQCPGEGEERETHETASPAPPAPAVEAQTPESGGKRRAGGHPEQEVRHYLTPPKALKARPGESPRSRLRQMSQPLTPLTPPSTRQVSRKLGQEEESDDEEEEEPASPPGRRGESGRALAKGLPNSPQQSLPQAQDQDTEQTPPPPPRPSPSPQSQSQPQPLSQPRSQAPPLTKAPRQRRVSFRMPAEDDEETQLPHAETTEVRTASPPTSLQQRGAAGDQDESQTQPRVLLPLASQEEHETVPQFEWEQEDREASEREGREHEEQGAALPPPQAESMAPTPVQETEEVLSGSDLDFSDFDMDSSDL